MPTPLLAMRTLRIIRVIEMQGFVAVKQASFVAMHEPVWQAFDDLCLDVDALGADERYKMVGLYRQICQHYALAKQRNYSPILIQGLHARVLVGHRQLYQQKKWHAHALVVFVLDTFPNAVRRYAGLFWLGLALFYLPCVAMGVACYFNHDLIYSVMSHHDVLQMETMYNPANHDIGERTAEMDIVMFGHYVKNNVGIDFQVYAAGLFFGVGTVFSLLYNGVIIGAVAGHLTAKGYDETFWQFVVGHGSFELTAIAVAAAAGFRLATPLIAPAPYSRKDAFKVAGRESVVLILGAAMMTFVAAFIEAFWSSSQSIPAVVKYVAAIGLWGFVGWYLLRCGRRSVVKESS